MKTLVAYIIIGFFKMLVNIYKTRYDLNEYLNKLVTSRGGIMKRGEHHLYFDLYNLSVKEIITKLKNKEYQNEDKKGEIVYV